MFLERGRSLWEAFEHLWSAREWLRYRWADGLPGVSWQDGTRRVEALPSLAMSTVSKDEIRALSRLARLRLTESEVESLQSDLTGILDHMELLTEVNTEGVIPMTHVGTSAQSLRPDEAHESLDRELVLSAAHRTQDECFAVPSILPSGGKES